MTHAFHSDAAEGILAELTTRKQAAVETIPAPSKKTPTKAGRSPTRTPKPSRSCPSRPAAWRPWHLRRLPARRRPRRCPGPMGLTRRVYRGGSGARSAAKPPMIRVDRLCGRSTLIGFSEFDPVTDWSRYRGFCSRPHCQEYARPVQERAHHSFTVRPEPIPNTGGLLPLVISWTGSPSTGRPRSTSSSTPPGSRPGTASPPTRAACRRPGAGQGIPEAASRRLQWRDRPAVHPRPGLRSGR